MHRWRTSQAEGMQERGDGHCHFGDTIHLQPSAYRPAGQIPAENRRPNGKLRGEWGKDLPNPPSNGKVEANRGSINIRVIGRRFIVKGQLDGGGGNSTIILF
jgi:hypothetical protein